MFKLCHRASYELTLLLMIHTNLCQCLGGWKCQLDYLGHDGYGQDFLNQLTVRNISWCFRTRKCCMCQPNDTVHHHIHGRFFFFFPKYLTDRLYFYNMSLKWKQKTFPPSVFNWHYCWHCWSILTNWLLCIFRDNIASQPLFSQEMLYPVVDKIAWW